MDGWLRWTWDTNEQPDLWSAMRDGGVIDQALAVAEDPAGSLRLALPARLELALLDSQ